MRHRSDAISTSDLMQVTDYDRALVHFVRYDAPDADRPSPRAVCGDTIDRADMGGGDDVTCPACRQWLDAYERLEF